MTYTYSIQNKIMVNAALKTVLINWASSLFPKLLNMVAHFFLNQIQYEPLYSQ